MKKILLSICILVMQLLYMQAQTYDYTYTYPEGWRSENVGLSGGAVSKSPNTGEVAYVPPYYYVKTDLYHYSHTTSYDAYVVTSLEKHVKVEDGDDGWIVQSVDEIRTEEALTPQGVVFGYEIPGAFTNCTNLKKIVLPPTIKDIGRCAFENCSLDELVCMAVTPPALETGAFDKATIKKIIVPKGTWLSYKTTEVWKDFDIEEGAETYSDNQMVEVNGAWYEVSNGEASLINSSNMTNPMMPETVTCFIKGEQKTFPVTEIREYSISKDVIIHDNITEVPGDFYYGGRLQVRDSHPTWKQLTDNIISNKNGDTVYFVFGNETTVPFGVSSIAANALNYCTTAVYLPPTLTYLEYQSSSPKKYFTSELPPYSTSSYDGFAPEECIDAYNAAGYGKFSEWNIPANFECYVGNSYKIFLNKEKNYCILNEYTLKKTDIDNDGNIVLPVRYEINETLKGSIDEYKLIFREGDGTGSLAKQMNICIPEGIKKISMLDFKFQYGDHYLCKIYKIYLPSTIEYCRFTPMYYGQETPISGLSIIDVNPNNTKLDSRDKCNAVVETATNTLMAACRTTTIPSTIEHIGDYAFKQVNINSNYIYIPAAIKSIGKHAFESTSMQIEFAPSSQLVSMGDSAFCKASGLTKMTLPNGIETINDGVFQSSGLREIHIGNKTKRIGKYAFRNTMLTALELPKSVISIDDGAFYDCRELTDINIPLNVVNIGKETFRNCIGLTSVTIPSSVTSIGGSAFAGCTGIQKVIAPNIAKWCAISFGGDASNPLYYAHHLYSDDETEITSLVIPDGVTSIGSYAFHQCTDITSIVIPQSVIEIGNVAFGGCESLEQIIFPESVTIMGSDVFYNTKWIEGLPEGIVYIGKILYGYKGRIPSYFNLTVKDGTKGIASGGFSNSWIKSVVIPSSVVSIGSYAFENCQSLSSVYSYIKEPLELEGTFNGINKYAKLYLPAGTLNKYNNVLGWDVFSQMIEIETEISPIETGKEISFMNSSFYNYGNLKNVIINNVLFNIDNITNTDTPNGFYDSNDYSIVIQRTTSEEDMQVAMTSEIGSSILADKFTGMIIEIKGKGSIKINAQTVGSNKLAVKIGNAEAKTFTQTEKGDVTVNYDVTDNTYVYIYAVDAHNQQQLLSMDVTYTATENAVKVYSMTVMPDVTAIENVSATIPSAVFGKIYSIDGKQFSQPQKGLNILKMSDGTTRKVVK